MDLRVPLIPGDCIIASGMISYSGPFTSTFRKALEKSWIKKLDELQILHTENVSMSSFLGVPV